MSEQTGIRLSGAGRAVTSRAAALGLCLAVVAVVGAQWSHEAQARIGLALFLAPTACVYVGALLAQSTSTLTAAAEFAIGGLVFICAWLSLSLGAMWLAVGYALHGTWDWLHHPGSATRLAAWFHRRSGL